MILNSAVHRFSDLHTHEFDLFINSIGFEERAGALVRRRRISSSTYLSLQFEDHQVLSFNDNLAAMNQVGARIAEKPLEFCRTEFSKFAAELSLRLGRKLRVGLDVSSMNRTMAATTLSALFAYREVLGSLELFYVPARFVEPTLTFSPIDQIGAVTPELSGFDSEPGLPIALVMGLGYEYGTALGLINQLEPQLTICLRAIGHDIQFEDAVRNANLQFDFSNYNVTVSEYELMDIGSAYRHIENIIYTLVGNFRVVLVPMGPKIFAALLTLVALKYFGRLAVWRVARPTDPKQVESDDMYISAEVDVGATFSEIHIQNLRNMIEARNLDFLKT